MIELCTWTEGQDFDGWDLRITLPVAAIPAWSTFAEARVESRGREGEAGAGSVELFAELNGITDRRNVAGGVMKRIASSARSARSEGAEYRAEVRVPRGYRGSLQFMPVPAGITTADRPTWLAALDDAFLPTEHGNLRRVADMRRTEVLEVAAPDATPLVWTASPAGSPPNRSDAQFEILDSTPRRVWTHRPDGASASAPALVVFDGERFVRGGLFAQVDALPSPPSLVIAIDHEPIEPQEEFDLRASDLVMNPRFCDNVLALVDRLTARTGSVQAGTDSESSPVTSNAEPAVPAPTQPSTRTIVAGASYGGLAAAYFALRHPGEFRGICLSPSFWQVDDLGRKIWDHVPITSAVVPDLRIANGTLEETIADSVIESVPEFSRRGVTFPAQTFPGGHEFLWWRELLLVHLAEVMAENRIPAQL